MRSYDVAVIGLGAMGGAAAYHCAKRGQRVLGLDANPPHHTLGSSHGATRAIRETYFESPDYVPLARRSHALWRELEAETRTSLCRPAGPFMSGLAVTRCSKASSPPPHCTDWILSVCRTVT